MKELKTAHKNTYGTNCPKCGWIFKLTLTEDEIKQIESGKNVASLSPEENRVMFGGICNKCSGYGPRS